MRGIMSGSYVVPEAGGGVARGGKEEVARRQSSSQLVGVAGRMSPLLCRNLCTRRLICAWSEG
jgi:hypothetical protein